MFLSQVQGIWSIKYYPSMFTARMAGFLAGFPDTTCMVSINRLCSSGLEACATVAAKIRAG